MSRELTSSECLVLYEENADFREYVDKYTKKHEISKEAAFNHVIIQSVGKVYQGVQTEQSIIKNLSQGVTQDIKRMNEEPSVQEAWDK